MYRITNGLITTLLASCLVLVACGSGEEPTPPPVATVAPAVAAAPVGDAQNGETLFNQTCIACHGPGGGGVTGLGKAMTTSEFIAGLDDAQLLEFIKKGRDPSDPANTTKVMMPPKGGNPALDDAKLLDVIAYIRTIHK